MYSFVDVLIRFLQFAIRRSNLARPGWFRGDIYRNTNCAVVMDNSTATEHNAVDAACYFKGVVDFVDNWFLMGTPWPILAIWLAYLAFVLKIGPAFMAKRPAFQLRTPLVSYNILQVALSGYIFYMGTYVLYKYGLVTSYCAIKGQEHAYILRGVYIYLLAKVSELIDTVFFVLRKKMNQVSFLHVYHHSLMMLITWASLKYNPTDSVVFIGTINSLVHMVMYAYYGLSAFPSLTKYLWWKKYITTFQLIQFGLMLLHVTANVYVSSCPTSLVLIVAILFNICLMIYLFRDFYMKAYVKKGTANGQSKINLEKTGNVTKIVHKDSITFKKIKSKGI